MRMRTRFVLTLLVSTLFIGGTAAPTYAIMGVPDKVPGASLLVPYFEADVNPAGARDTLLAVVNHQTAGSRILHVQVWDRDGVRAFGTNTTLAALATYSQSVRALINSFATAGQKTQLTVGGLYLGFITIDSVTVATALDPRNAAYPLENSNVFTGNIYYTRLAEGSAKGLGMIALEAGTAADTFQTGFYRGADNREEIDLDARVCTDQLARGVACTGDSNSIIGRLFFRTFASGAPLDGRSDLIVFTWDPTEEGGPTPYCEAHTCSTDYVYRRRDESGTTVVNTTFPLAHVVNVISVDSPAVSGHSVFFDIPSIENDMQFFHFSINQANPTGHPELTFDAVFEGEYTP